MANEIRLSALMVHSGGGLEVSDQIRDLLVSPASTVKRQWIQTVGFASEEAIDIGQITTPGWFMARNLDPTNFVELRVATGGAKFAKLHPLSDPDDLTSGGFCLLFLGSGAQAPYAIADTGNCDVLFTVADQ